MKTLIRYNIYPRHGGSWLKRGIIMLLVSLTAAVGSAQTTALLYNLNAPGPGQNLVGDIETVSPGLGFGVGLTMGATPYTVNSLTLEFLGNSLPAPGLNIQILSSGPSFTPYGQFGNPTLSSQPTLWPGTTTFVNFTPTSPITLEPNTRYIISAFEVATGNDDNGLLFGYSHAYTYGGDVQVPVGDFRTQYTFDQNTWVNIGAGGGAELVMALNATAAPEPQVWALALTAFVITTLTLQRKQTITS